MISVKIIVNGSRVMDAPVTCGYVNDISVSSKRQEDNKFRKIKKIWFIFS